MIPQEARIDENANTSVTKRMATAFLESASYWTGIAAVVLTGLAAIAGALTWYFTARLSDQKDKDFRTFKKASETEIARAKEHTAKLENDAAQARLELARIDPINLPIKSIKAEIFLIVRGKFFDWYFTNPDTGKESSSVSIYDKEGAVVTLRCTAFKSFEYLGSGGGSKAIGRTFSMSFAWPSSDWIDAQSEYRYWIERANASTAMLDKVTVAADVVVPPSEDDMETVMSSFVVTINGSIQRKFVVPKTVKAGGVIVCAPQK